MQLEDVLKDVLADVADHIGEGKVANYIPALAKIDPKKFGMAVVTVDGDIHVTGDAEEAFSIQSISKVFTLTLALGRVGEGLWKRVGREPSGTPFNSIVQLEQEHGIPRNPFINAGAIVVADTLLSGHQPRETLGEILSFMRYLTDDDSIIIDAEVARSEQQTGFRNAALANYMHAFSNIHNPVEKTLGVYFHQCALSMNCVQLARAGLFLANRGLLTQGGRSVVSWERARRINALMLTCGHYDASGDFAFRVGLPGKSGVGGGILAIAPGKAAIAVWSPGLNANGNSATGTKALESLARRTGWSIFG
ncbi:glutaminase [Rhizobium sp. TH2]|uniref:glutaminase n=1 Tax=Rhizobium sp. TH2 TaxID=2775403 RepID=UPI00215836CA|nr:glutaminase [Rhizobium sp. TH2]UVC11556.1 glutaminase [Rhizobium sp. TH2]